MTIVALAGRLSRDPDTHRNGDSVNTRFSIAVGRKYKDENGEYKADFPSCVAFGKTAEFIDKYFKKGMAIGIRGRIQTGSYTNRDGQRVYTTEVIIEDQEFAESRNSSSQGESSFSQSFRQNEERPRESQSINQAPADAGDGFMNIPDGVSDEGLPFA